ncbi:hypothetical protein KL864_31230 [Mycolicibacterium goodii]|uniref:hypothetical protein n=1 Tax=Mycolicibacterium goodii TaxID=134601 RepID=UPI001BDDA38A|nr:hypothetical protein [Mycolicibacterium goodii]MBU8820356.1 hypothetical protein [Mycolicibacterium goodii]
MSDVATVARHAMILTPTGSFTTTGRRLAGAVDSADKLGRLILWAADKKRGGLRPIPGPGGNLRPARVWVVGGAVRLLTGAPPDSTDTPADRLSRALAPLVGDGWELRKGIGPAVVMAYGRGADRVLVEILVEQQPWLAGGQESSTDDAGELGRRLGRWYDALGVLPGASGALSGAAVVDHIMDSRDVSGQGAVVSEPGLLPGWVNPETRVQPAWLAPAERVEKEFARCDELMCLTQHSPALASAGMLTFGHGQAHELDAAAATAAASVAKRPFGQWLVDLPAAKDLGLPEGLPLPHPQMAVDHSVQAWVSTEDLDGLTTAIRDGGAGLSIGRLNISEAVVWPQKTRLLDTWAKRLRAALETFADDAALRALVEAAASDYLASLCDPYAWAGDELGHHYQPAWAAAIATHVRYRQRRAAMRISREYHAWPVYIEGTTMVYGPSRPQEEGEPPVDLSDTHNRLGRLVTIARAELTEQTIMAMLLAETPDQAAEALGQALGIALPIETGQPVVSSSNHTYTAERNQQNDENALDETRSEQQPGQQEVAAANLDSQVTNAPTNQRRPAKPSKALGGTPAAILDTDGLWLADGTHIELQTPIVHVGQVAELAYTHRLGYQLSETFSEPGQIWLTVEACEAFGIDVDAIDPREPSKSLRELTNELPFVEDALAQGWRLGGVAEGTKPGLGAWTRIYRDGEEKKGVWVVLTAGLPGDEKSMPIFGGDPTPAQVARRLKLLADALGFPWKINANSTSIDLMVQSRPKTWSPKEWKDVVLAPSTTEVPFNITDVETIFNWSRQPTSKEQAMKYLHAYDRGGSYVAGIAGLELPIGDPTHHPDGAEFDPKVPAYHLIEIPEQQDWLMPYVLNPKGYKFTEPKWVCTPRIDQAIRMGYQPTILESYTWQQHGRVLVPWYERFRDANTSLDIDDLDCQAARDQAKVVRSSGIGILGSDLHYKGKLGYNPERRLHVISKADANIAYRIHDIGVKTGRWPLAVLRDTVFYASDEVDPAKAWPGSPQTYGRGFGKYKPERSGLLEPQLKYLNGHGYQGKTELTPVKQWRLEHGLTTAA